MEQKESESDLLQWVDKKTLVKVVTNLFNTDVNIYNDFSKDLIRKFIQNKSGYDNHESNQYILDPDIEIESDNESVQNQKFV